MTGVELELAQSCAAASKEPGRFSSPECHVGQLMAAESTLLRVSWDSVGVFTALSGIPPLVHTAV